jgi:hypothetical protein
MKYTNILNGRRLLLGASLVGVSAAWAQQPVGQWDFNSNLNGAPGGAATYRDGVGTGFQFNTTTAFGIPDIGGTAAGVIKIPAGADSSSGLNLPVAAAPNGGSAAGLVNDYTLVMDVLFPAEAAGKVRGLVEADGGTVDPDAEFFVNARNALGTKASAFGSVTADAWHRLGIVVNGSAGKISFYVNGTEVGTAKPANMLDGRFALGSGGVAGIFTDDTGETAVAYLNSAQLRDAALTKAQMLALGGAQAAGIPATLPPVPSSIEKWVPAGDFANRNTEIGAIINPGSTTVQDSSISLKLDGATVASPSITRAGGLITVKKTTANLFAPGTDHTIEVTFTDSLGGQKTVTRKFAAALFYEDFEGLPLGPRKDEVNAATEAFEQGWTHTTPAGWSIDNSQFVATVISPENPDADGDGYADNDGRTEWAGWSFANKDFWVAADNQTRDQFTLAQGTVAVADPDEWDDQAHAVSLFNSFLKTPQISLSGIAPGTAFLKFFSSWRPEGFDDPNASKFPVDAEGNAINNQTAIITVSFDGGAPIQILKYDSKEGSPTFKADAQNETVTLPLNNPAGAQNMVLTFSMTEAANDWWWAIDNVIVSAGAAPPVIAMQPAGKEVNEGAAAELSVVAQGSDLTYQWFKGLGSARTAVSGATAATLSLASVKIEHAGYYSVDIKNPAGTTTSANAKLAVLPSVAGRLTLLSEDFEALVLGPNQDESVVDETAWTHTPPEGWSIDNTGVPGAGTDNDGVTEWAGWSFADKTFWAQAGGQNRAAFVKGTGTVAIGDSDEWDDAPHEPGNMATYLKTKSISLAGAKANSVILKFDSSWNPEDPQKGNITVAFDGGTPVEVFRLESSPSSANYRPAELSETIALRINNPAGAQNMTITFGYFDTLNNWWWAFDNLVVLADPQPKLTDGLAVHLPFDGGYFDNSGNGRAGSAVGSPTLVAGKIGQALNYSSKKDGTSFNYVKIGGSPIDLGTTDFSVSFWAKIAGWEGDPSFISNKDWNSGGNKGFVVATGGDGRIQWNIADAARVRKDYDSPGGKFNDGAWHHVVVTFARDGQGVTYFDGAELNRTAITGLANVGAPANLNLNVGQDGTGTYTDGGGVGIADGNIDDMAVWTRALGASEVTEIYTKGQAGQSFITVTSAAWVGQWDFNSNLNGAPGGAATYRDGVGTGFQFNTTTAFGIPDIGGTAAGVIKIPAGADSSSGLNLPVAAAPNGGSAAGLVNDYTLVMDVLFPAEAAGKVRGLVEADGGTVDPDAEFFVNARNALGTKASAFGSVTADAWHRLGIVVNGSAGKISFYVNGTEVGTAKPANMLDGRFALGSGGVAGIFTDDTGETAVAYLNSAQLRDAALTKAQMLALGGAQAAGIPATLPPVPSSIEKWVPAGDFANRNTEIGAIINPGSTTVQDSSISLKLDGATVASPSITRAGGLITVKKTTANLFAPGTDHTIEVTFTDSLGGQKTVTRKFAAALFYEDFEGLPLGPRKDEVNAATEAFEQGWTHTTPAGWSIDNSQFVATVISPENPDADGDGYADNDGRTEWAGWSFANKDFWVAADNQTRDQFTLAQGTVAVADPDEWDDQAHAVSLFNSFLKTPQISLSGIAPGTAFLKFFSSWRPEGFDDPNASKFPVDAEGNAINNQTAIITVSFDGGAPIQILKYDSKEGSPTFKADAQNETVTLPLNNPAGAQNMVLTFSMTEAANDWWWAIDNVIVSAGAAPPVIAMQPAGKEVNEGAAAELSVVAQGSDLTYQWFKGLGSARTAVSGATAATLSLASVKIEHAGYYSVDIKNPAGTTTSANAKLAVLPSVAGRLTLLSEDFEALVLGPNQDESVVDETAWTHTPPEGWSIDNTGVPGAGTDNDGVTEWAGWSFADKTFWAQAGGQNRAAFVKGTGTVAIGDSDEWDDAPHEPGNMATYLKTKSISLAGAKANSVILKFDSSWNPEDPQKGNITVAFDGGTPVEVFRLESSPSSANYRPAELSETIALRINNPAGAQNMTITFGYFDTLNNWWWAFDNLVVLADPQPKLTDGLAVHLPFDGGYFDNSGNGRAGSAVGSPTLVAGKIGQALNYSSKKDGTSFNYVKIGGSPIDLGTTDFSVSFWAKIAGWEGDPSFISNKDWNSGGNKGFVVATGGDGRIQWNIADAARVRKDYDSPGGKFNDGAWHHVVVTFARDGQGVTYFDGAELNRTAITGLANVGAPANLNLNVGQDGTGTYTDGGGVGIADGNIDDMAVWTRALGASEVTEIYTKGQAGQSFITVTPPSGPLVNPSPNIPGLAGGAFSDVQADAGAKTISAKLPASGDQGFLTITPGVTVKSVQIVGDRLVITYE